MSETHEHNGVRIKAITELLSDLQYAVEHAGKLEALQERVNEVLEQFPLSVNHAMQHALEATMNELDEECKTHTYVTVRGIALAERERAAAIVSNRGGLPEIAEAILRT